MDECMTCLRPLGAGHLQRDSPRSQVTKSHMGVLLPFLCSLRHEGYLGHSVNPTVEQSLADLGVPSMEPEGTEGHSPAVEVA